MYATTIGRFITKDSWQGDYNRPASLNQWNYVEANPVSYADPSGHIKEGMQAKRADLIVEKLKLYNVYIEKDWGYSRILKPRISRYDPIRYDCGPWEEGNWRNPYELELTLDGVKKMAQKLGGIDKFKSALWGWQIAIKRMPDDFYLNNYVAWTVLDIKFYNATFNGTDIFASGTVVHELAHVWDTRQVQMFNLSRKMTLVTGSYNLYCTGGCEWIYDKSGQLEAPPTSYGETGPREDFADSFAICVYPNYKGASSLSRYPIRESYIEGLLNGNKCSR